MLWRQTIYFLGKSRILAKFLARILIGPVSWRAAGALRLIGFLNRAGDVQRIRLESAARVGHMIPCDLENHQVPASRVF